MNLDWKCERNTYGLVQLAGVTATAAVAHAMTQGGIPSVEVGIEAEVVEDP